MFAPGDKIVHPMHGAGKVEGIVDRDIGGEIRRYYKLKIPVGDMTVLIPVDTSGDIGVRPVMGKAQAISVLEAIPSIDAEMTSNWNQREMSSILGNRSFCFIIKIINNHYNLNIPA